MHSDSDVCYHYNFLTRLEQPRSSAALQDRIDRRWLRIAGWTPVLHERTSTVCPGRVGTAALLHLNESTSAR